MYFVEVRGAVIDLLQWYNDLSKGRNGSWLDISSQQRALSGKTHLSEECSDSDTFGRGFSFQSAICRKPGV